MKKQGNVEKNCIVDNDVFHSAIKVLIGRKLSYILKENIVKKKINK